MKKNKVVSFANFVLQPYHLESNHGISETVPDMTISIREQYNRAQSGGRVKTNSDDLPNIPYGLSDIDVDNIHRMDKIEKHLASRRVADFVADSRGRLSTSIKAAEKQAIIDEYRRSQAPPPPPINEGPST